MRPRKQDFDAPPEPLDAPLPDAGRIANTDAESRYFDLARVCDQPVMVCTSGLIRFANDAAIGMLGATHSGQVLRQPIASYLSLATVPVTDPVAGRATLAEVDLDRLDRSRTKVCVGWMPCRYEGNDGVQIVMREMIAHRNLERRLQFLSRHDVLTEIPNRGEFRDRLVGAIARAQRNNRLVAVMTLNIDRFREVNVVYGNDAADLVLQTCASRLIASIRKADSAARIGADEFALILEAIDERSQTAVVANRTLAALRQPIDAAGKAITITVSAGIAAFPVDADEPDKLLRMVDVAMYAAKSGGGDGFRFYFADMESQTRRDDARRMQIAARMELLTPREREVMKVLVAGNSNKAVGYLLGASPRTIENHRAKVMQKMQAESMPDLVRMVLEAAQAK